MKLYKKYKASLYGSPPKRSLLQYDDTMADTEGVDDAVLSEVTGRG